jgi:hypothetical protein
MLSVFVALFLLILAVGVELQGRQKWGLNPSSPRALFRALFDGKSEPSTRAKLFCLASAVIFALWESLVFFLFNFQNSLVAGFSILGFVLLCGFIFLRMKLFFWVGGRDLSRSLNLAHALIFFLGFCLLVFAPVSAGLFGVWIAIRWRQKSGDSQIDHNSLPK